jgi:Fe-S-cluster containining protein
MRDRRRELFECQRCGICCTGIELPYDPKSIFEIAKFLGLTVENTIEKYYGRMSEDGKSWESEEDKRKPCPFLAPDSYGKKSCQIHTVKPYGCRLYPFDSNGGLDCPVARTIYDKLRNEDAEQRHRGR